MTKKTKKYQDTAIRAEWKNEMDDTIITLQDDIDEAFEAMNIDESVLKMIEKALVKFKEKANETIDQFTLTTEIVFSDKNLFEELLDEIKFGTYPAGECELGLMVDIVTDSTTGHGGEFIKAESLAEQIKLEAFLEDFRANPYQLKLIA